MEKSAHCYKDADLVILVSRFYFQMFNDYIFVLVLVHSSTTVTPHISYSTLPSRRPFGRDQLNTEAGQTTNVHCPGSFRRVWANYTATCLMMGYILVEIILSSSSFMLKTSLSSALTQGRTYARN